ncbi:hypothetical protein N7G274_007815 [Stereocaulon virgatum]|uniref:Nucleoporin NUP37 n=1 Tax=Stereocaulon virgatum TaxID=373712 RepID=A0ABR4A3B6_9LECA
MKPNVRSIDGLLQICYDLPHRVHTAKAYPLTSPNGSTIIVYGHEHGIRLIWEGGRPFKRLPEDAQRKPKPNGSNRDTVISLDSGDEEPVGKAEPFQVMPLFESEEEEYDSSEPYQTIIQTLELPLGVEVLHLAFPHLPADRKRARLDTWPKLMSEKLICAFTCSDFTVRVLTVPLIPPSPRSKATPEVRNVASNLSAERSFFGEHIVTLMGSKSHQSLPKGVSISITERVPEDDDEEGDDVEMEDDGSRGTKSALSRSASRSRSRSRVAQDQGYDLIVASHSADLSGLLLVYRIPFEAGGSGMSTEQHGPWRTQYLASPAVSVEFNSAQHPASRHSRLLVAEAKGVVRIFDCLPQSKTEQGSWLLSLHTPLESSQDSMPRRKAILDARWVLEGKSILVLLADSKYGIWDIENAGPKAADTATIPPALTAFAVEGRVGDSIKPKPFLKSSSTKNETKSKLAPMTPSTRKIRQEALFAGPAAQSGGPTLGGLYVSPTQDTPSGRPADDAILLWYGTTIMIIPSLFTHWQNYVHKAGNLFGTGAKGEPKLISNIQLCGESCNEAGMLPVLKGPGKNPSDQAEILVTGEHRLLIVTSPPVKPPQAAEPTSPPLSSSADQQLLAKGELDVHGMDRILAGMSNGHTPARNSCRSYGKGKNLLLS